MDSFCLFVCLFVFLVHGKQSFLLSPFIQVNLLYRIDSNDITNVLHKQQRDIDKLQYNIDKDEWVVKCQGTRIARGKPTKTVNSLFIFVHVIRGIRNPDQTHGNLSVHKSFNRLAKEAAHYPPFTFLYVILRLVSEDRTLSA